MATIVNTGSTLTVTQANGLTLTADSQIAVGGLLDGAGAVTGAFSLLNKGTIEGDGASGDILSINTGTFSNQGTVRAFNSSVYIRTSVSTPNLSNGTLSGGVWEAYADLRLLTGLITTDDATITLSGSFEDFNSVAGTMQPVLNSLSVVGTTGLLNLDGPNWVTSGSIVDSGTVAVAASTISASGGITVSASGVLIDFNAPIMSPLTVDGTFEVNGSLFVPASVSGTGTLVANGNLELQAATAYTQTIVNNGGISNATTGGIISFAGGVSGSGEFVISGGSSALSTSGFELPASITNNVVVFDANHGELILDSPSNFNGKIDYFNNNDTIVLKDLIANSASLSTVGNNEILTIRNNGSPVASLTLVPFFQVNGRGNQDYSNAAFTAAPDTLNNATTITVSGVVTSNACFRVGTRIATPSGEILVEQLAVGDCVTTYFARERRIIWIGHRSIDCRHHPDPSLVSPVRVAAHAFGSGRPHRDLFLSPNHAVFVDGVLIPIKHLINSRTIAQVMVETVTYFHVELEDHDVLLAEGLAAESYLDTGDRASFANGGPAVALFPEFGVRTWEMMGCAPLAVVGCEVDKARSYLEERANLASALARPRWAVVGRRRGDRRES